MLLPCPECLLDKKREYRSAYHLVLPPFDVSAVPTEDGNELIYSYRCSVCGYKFSITLPIKPIP